MRKTANALLFVAVGALTLSGLAIAPAAADHSRVVVVSRPVDIRVWVQDDFYHDHDWRSCRHDHEYDVYRSLDDLVLCVQAERNTYATVYVVDTDGFIHVVHPFSPQDNAFLRGGRVYKFDMRDAGFCDGTGVAYAYAVSSPVPFRYSHYGWGVFGANYGFRIYGDPYIASRQFYLNLLVGDVRLIGVSHARFYIREYVRYPSYLCAGWHDYYGVHSYCRGDCSAFRHYRIHSTDPYRVLHPQHDMKYKAGGYTQITRVTNKPAREMRERVTVRKPVRQQNRVVVRSSKGSFVKGKNNVSEMREQLKKRDSQRRHDELARVSAKTRKDVTAKTTRVAAQKSKKDRTDKVSKVSKKQRSSDAKKSSKGKSASDDKKSSKKAKHGAR